MWQPISNTNVSAFYFKRSLHQNLFFIFFLFYRLPENIAHLNIPLRNGVISMRPKKLADVNQQILEDLDPVTVDQLRTLKTNIDKIVSMVDKAGF